MEFQVGERIGDYQVIDVLGAGGMGKVYKVKNVFSERIEALKILLPNLESDPELADRFKREIKVLGSLEHPNIAGLRTAQEVNNQLLMIVEFVDGISLEQWMRQGPVPVKSALDCISQVLAALGYAHKQGIIHRDIKPGNIMITHSGAVKLMDFGIAKAVADRGLTKTGRTVGSLYYMSPEQIQGSETLDGRADLYSLGVTLYELATGQRPFRGDSDYSIMAAHLSQKPIPPIQVDPKVPEALNAVILQSISKDPAQRFQSAEAFRGALEHVARGLAAPIGGTMPLPKASPPLPPVAQAVAQDAHVTPGSSKRALYMVVGSVVTVAVLALAAFQVPRFFRTQARATDPVAQTQPAPREESAVPQAPAPDPAAASAPASNPMHEMRPTAREATVQPRPQVDRRSPQSPPVEITQASPPPQAPAAVTQIQQPKAETPAPPANAIQTQQIDELSDQFNLLAARANTARTGLKRLEEQQARMGLGLRGDMTTAASRMGMFMDQAESALKGRDSAASKKAIESAEREVERIEKVLEGR